MSGVCEEAIRRRLSYLTSPCAAACLPWQGKQRPDGSWKQIVDQTRISYSMPMQRSHKTGLIPISLLQPLALTAKLDTVTLISSTNVNGALNTITLTFSIRKMADNAKTIVPLGTLIHLGGFPGLSTPESQSFGIHSANLCALPVRHARQPPKDTMTDAYDPRTGLL